jgi:putative CocE/NonD family hydrolase
LNTKLKKLVGGALSGLIIGVILTPPLAADDPPAFDLAAHYTKFEYRIPMRDGVHLFTAVYVPKDASKTYPFFVNRTPYSVGPYGEGHYPSKLGPTHLFDEAGYIFVMQDVRGRWQSEGDYDIERPHIDHPDSRQVDESTDMYDTVEWLLHNIPNNNGRVGLYGVSYNGFYATASIIDSHPAIKACSPQAPVTDFYMGDDWYHNGALMLDAAFDFLPAFRRQANPMRPPEYHEPFVYGSADSYDFFLRAGSLSELDGRLQKLGASYFSEVISHPNYDAFWQARDISRHLHNVHCAVLNVGGLFDAEDISGPVKTFHAIESQSPDATDLLVEGPWVHGGWAERDDAAIGNVRFGSKTGDFFRTQIQFPFFEHYLKGADDAHLPKAYVFETGTNVWRRYASWPPADAQWRTLYLQAAGGLAFQKPGDGAGSEYDEYVSDPEHPVPSVGYAYGPVEGVNGCKVPKEYMVSDQRFAAKRPDVLVYQTPPLDEDVTVVGPVEPKLFVSTSGTDSDWVVKLIDVYPADTAGMPGGPDKPTTDVPMPAPAMGGYEQLVRGEPMRGKFRHSFEHPEAFTPGKVEEVDFSMPDVSHTFRAGHRIMVQVQSSWFPLTDRNPQTFTDIPQAKPGEYLKATERIYHSQAAPSGIVVGTIATH